jgi:hypothetical protein
MLYYAVAGVVGFVVLVALWQAFFTKTPTCSDGVQNGTELGVDCGGTCSLVCKNQAQLPNVKWARSFQTNGSLYTAAAYIENPNPTAGAKNVHYAFQLYDDKNVLVVEREGTIDLPPTRLIPIVETGINIGQRTVARTVFSFESVPEWHRVGSERASLRFTSQDLGADGARLSGTLVNDSLVDPGKVTVVAVLFDAQNVARAASKTTLTVPKKSSQSVVFTWPQGVRDIVRAEVTTLSSF